MSESLKQAMALLGMDPLPADTYQRLAALEQAAPAEELDFFGDLWEAYYAAGGEDPPEDEAA